MDKQLSPPQIKKLLGSFHSLLDESLIVAIAGDYDLDNEVEYGEACATLQTLAEHATAEEASGFDRSGVYRIWEGERGDVTVAKSPTIKDSDETEAQESNLTHNGAFCFPANIRELSKFGMLESDVLQLQNLFPDLKSFDIRHALIEANGVIATALDNLLSVQYFRSTSDQTTPSNGSLSADNFVSVEAFGRGVETNGYDGKNLVYNANSIRHTKALNTPAAITYIADRFNMPTEEVSIIYAENGNSKGATIIGILDQFLAQRDVKPSTSSEKKAVDDLKHKHRNVPEGYLRVIIQITGPMSTHATELASLVNAYFSKRSMSQKLELGYRLTPLPREDIEGVAGMGVDALIEGQRICRKSIPGTTSGAGVNLTQALQTSNKLQKQKHDAIASAASLYRRGASNPLYRQAAGYYAQQAREHARRAEEATSAAADIYVDQQSTESVVDLHGVSVHDGVRIARQQALNWWQRLHESRAGHNVADRNLTIITGVGHHSVGGISPMRRAVADALIQDGWKLEIETGKFIITGRG